MDNNRIEGLCQTLVDAMAAAGGRLGDLAVRLGEYLAYATDAIQAMAAKVAETYGKPKRRKFQTVKQLGSPCVGYPGKIRPYARSTC